MTIDNFKEEDYQFLLKFFRKYKKIESIRKFVEENSYFDLNKIDFEQIMVNSILSALNDDNSLYMTKEQFENYVMFHLASEEVKYNYVKEKIIFTKKIDNYLYLNIQMFKECTSDVFLSELLNYNVSSYKGLVIDLRGNMGGIIEEAVKISKMLLNHNLITIIVLKNNKKRYVYSDKNCFNIPIYLLIDEHTGSAAELLCSALIENNRAVAVGCRTYGKGTIQKTVKLYDGSGLKLTIAEFLSPMSNTIEKVGIKPTFEFSAKTIEEYINFIQTIGNIEDK